MLGINKQNTPALRKNALWVDHLLSVFPGQRYRDVQILDAAAPHLQPADGVLKCKVTGCEFGIPSLIPRMPASVVCGETPPDELNLVVEEAYFGWLQCFGNQSLPPVRSVGAGASIRFIGSSNNLVNN